MKQQLTIKKIKNEFNLYELKFIATEGKIETIKNALEFYAKHSSSVLAQEVSDMLQSVMYQNMKE